MLKRKNNVKAWKTGQLSHLTPGSQNTNQRIYVTSPSSTSLPPLLLSPNPSFPPLSSLEIPVSLIVPFLGENRITIRFLGSFGALFFLPKNAIKTHNLATKTRKNSAKTLKNALFSLENASEQPETPLYRPETPPHWPHQRLNPGKSMANPGNRRHYKTAAGSVSAVLASSVPYI